MNRKQKTENRKPFGSGLVILCLIVILSTFLRFYRLGQVPPALDWDEASRGYNAWALLETGRDEFGNSWPLSIRSFGDYKPPIYTYLLIPSLKIFGRSEFAVRFPSALTGTLTVLVTYFLAGVLLRSDLGFAQGRTFSDRAALISALLLAISPWHLQFSRIAFEANVGLFFFVTGMWLLLRGLRQNLPWSLFFCVVSMSAAMMTYHSFRIVIPLVVLVILGIYRKEVWSLLRSDPAAARSDLFRKLWVPIIFSTILTLLTILTISYTVFFQNVGQSRFNETSFLTIDDLMTVSRQRIENSSNNFLERVVNHRFLVYGRQYLKGYLDHYNLRFWFLDGDRNDRHRTPGVGLLYWWELPLMVMGFMSLMGRMSPMAAKEKAALFLWIMAAPAAAALTGGTPSAVRSLVFLPTFQIIEGVGAVWLIWRIRSLFFVFCFLFLAAFEISYYFHQYYVQAAVETAPSWQYGYKQMVNRVISEKDSYEKVIVTTAYDQPYIYFLWYGNYSPKLWINDGEFNKWFDNFEFRKIDWEQFKDQENTLIVSSPGETKGRTVKWQVTFPDGRTVFNVTEL